jgi:hypothetical protein
MNFACAIARTAFDLRYRPLRATVQRIRSRKEACAPKNRNVTADEVVSLVRIFRLLTPFVYTAQGACLFDSLALVEFLARQQIFPTWIIGLRTRPFGAHSWVQHQQLLLNEQPPEAEEFVPILAV